MAIAATDLRLVVVLLLLLRRLGLLLFLGVGLALLPFALLGKCIDKGAFLAVVKVLLAGGRSGGQGTGSVSRAQGSGARGQWRQSTLRRVKDVQRVVFRLPAHNGLFAAEALHDNVSISGYTFVSFSLFCIILCHLLFRNLLLCG